MARSSAPRPTSALTLLLGSALAAGAALGVPTLFLACGSETAAGGDEDGGGVLPDGAPAGDGGGGLGDGGGGGLGDGGYFAGDGAPGTCIPLVLDGGVSPQCADCLDNDGDGKIDAFDPECAGPLDNDEATFGTGIPGDNQDACKQDCFFDGNSGSGDDKCTWDLRCDQANVSAATCPYDPDFKNCPGPQPEACRTFCAPLAPNGCDCFGCCSVPKADGGVANVRLADTCSSTTLDDPTKCTPCTPSTDCRNPCDTCELCIGKATLPPECAAAADGGAGNTCTGGIACNAQTPCPQGNYCLTGCCVKEPVVR